MSIYAWTLLFSFLYFSFTGFGKTLNLSLTKKPLPSLLKNKSVHNKSIISVFKTNTPYPSFIVLSTSRPFSNTTWTCVQQTTVKLEAHTPFTILLFQCRLFLRAKSVQRRPGIHDPHTLYLTNQPLRVLALTLIYICLNFTFFFPLFFVYRFWKNIKYLANAHEFTEAIVVLLILLPRRHPWVTWLLTPLRHLPWLAIMSRRVWIIVNPFLGFWTSCCDRMMYLSCVRKPWTTVYGH